MYQTHLRVDGLFAGVLLAYVYHFRQTWLVVMTPYRNVLLLVGIISLVPMAVWSLEQHPFVATFGLSLLYVGYACLLVSMLLIKLNCGFLGHLCGSRIGRSLAFVGFYSYPIYLWHTDLGVAVARVLPLWQGLPQSGAVHWLIGTLSYVLLSIIGGMVAGRLVELPALALRDRLFPPRAQHIDLS